MTEITPYDPDVAAEQIYHYRKAGKSFTQIRSELMYLDWDLSISQIVSLFRNFQKSLTEAYGADEREQLLGLELERLDALQEAWWDHATLKKVDPEDPTDYRPPNKDAATIVLNVMKQRHRLLGLDLPTGTESNVQQTMLVIGQNSQDWLDALEQGKVAGKREMPMLTGHVLDDGDVAEEETHE